MQSSRARSATKRPHRTTPVASVCHNERRALAPEHTLGHLPHVVFGINAWQQHKRPLTYSDLGQHVLHAHLGRANARIVTSDRYAR
jgi:hypothetical protein